MRNTELTGIFSDVTDKPTLLNILAYPNPFNSQIKFTLKGSEGGEDKIAIYNLRGRLVKELRITGMLGGDKTAVWDATDAYGEKVSSGIYFAKATDSNYSSTMKLLYLK